MREDPKIAPSPAPSPAPPLATPLTPLAGNPAPAGPPPGGESATAAHLQTAWHELHELALDYVKLTKLHWQRGSQDAKRAVGLFSVATMLGICGLGPVIYGVVGLLVARTPAVHELSLITTIAAALCLIGSGLASAVGLKLLARTWQGDGVSTERDRTLRSPAPSDIMMH